MDRIKIILKKNSLLIIVIIATIIAFMPSINGDFLHWDDDTFILENTALHALTIENLKLIFFDYYESVIFFGIYVPLTNLSLAIEYSIVGTNPTLYHINNLLLHIVNILLVYSLLKNHLVKNQRIAIITAALFAIAPIHVESVAWIIERKDVLYSAFYLLSLILYFKYIEKNKNKFYFLSLLAFFLSVISKGMAVSLPLILISIDYFYNRKLLSKKLILEKIPFFTISITFGILNILAQLKYYQVKEVGYSIYQQIVFSSYSFTNYITKSLLPFNLSVFHPYPNIKNGIPFVYYLYIIPTLIVFAAIIFALLKKKKRLVFGLTFFVFNILFVLQVFIHNTEAIISERYAYLSSLGLFFLLALLIERIKNKNKNFIYYFLIAYLLVMSIVTFNRNKVWQNDLNLFTDIHKKYPKTEVGTYNLGNTYLRKGNLNKAEYYYKKTIEINPDWEGVYSNLAGIYFYREDYNKTLEYYNKAIKLNSKNHILYVNRAKVFFKSGEYKKAINSCDTAININHVYCEAYKLRSIAECYNNSLQKARKDYLFLNEDCTNLTTEVDFEFSKFIKYYNQVGKQYIKAEKYDKAISNFKNTLILDPNNKLAKQNIILVDSLMQINLKE